MLINEFPPLQEIVKKYKLTADKNFGQNFLFDINLTDKIVRLAGNLSDKIVVEIGPGPGGLTRSILKTDCKKLYAIEKDPRCIAALEDYLVPHSKGRLEIIAADALDMQIYKNISASKKIIANLPYNISTQLLMGWMDIIDQFESFTLMFQREVAHRIVANIGTKDYSRLSIKSQWLCDVRKEFDISPKAFFPPPKVTSSIVNLIPKDSPITCDKKKFDLVSKAAFGQRRKTIRSSLKNIVANPEELLKKADIDFKNRAEQLTISQFCKIANMLDS